MVYSFIGLDKNALVTSPLSFVATSNAALMNNAEVIFCDVDETTGIITAEEIEKNNKLNKKVKVYAWYTYWKSSADE